MAFELNMIKRALGVPTNPPRPDALTIPPTGTEKAIGEKEIAKAIEVLKKYKDGKTNYENKIVENEQWFKLRHWDIIRGGGNDGKRAAGDDRPEPASAWLFNSLAGKHSDAMDNYPEPNVLPREETDEADAEALSSIIPVVLERNHFEDTYSMAWWYKLKHGTAPYGVFWNSRLENGMGDIDIKQLDMLNIFFEAGITDIQDSRNLFIVSLADTDLLEQEYPQLKGKIESNKVVDVKEYVYDDTVDTSDKAVVVDWYYKKFENGRVVLHFCKFVGNNVLFATENEPENYPNGWYEHGQYPVVFDVLFPEAGTPYGFGYLDIMKDPQTYIDKLSQVILENSVMATKPRYFSKKNVGINEEEFLDWSKPIVHVEGQISEEYLMPIDRPTLPSGVLDVLQMKIDELKETSSNRDVSQGSAGSGITSGAAISALQEAGNKTSRDMIGASYRCYTKLNYLIIELIRQFYDENRSFRIIGNQGAAEYIQYNNSRIKGIPLQPAYEGEDLGGATRVPVFDIVIKPQKRSSYSRLAQNELAKELYNLGLFDPARAEMSMTCLEMMDFDGDDKVKQKVQQGQTLLNELQTLQMQAQQLNIMLARLTGQDMLGQMQMAQQMQASAPQPQAHPQQSANSGQTLASKMESSAKANQTSYGRRLMERAKPDMNAGSEGAV